MPDDLTIEVTASAGQANTALAGLIKRLDEFQTHIDSITPSVTKFTERLNSIASSSKAFKQFESVKQATQIFDQFGNVIATVSAKTKPLAKAGVDTNQSWRNTQQTLESVRKTFSAASDPIKNLTLQIDVQKQKMETLKSKYKDVAEGEGASSVQALNLQSRMLKVGETINQLTTKLDRMKSALASVGDASKGINTAPFSMPAADFAAKYNHSGNGGVGLTPQTSEGTEAGPAPANAPVEKFDISKIQANIDSMKPKINIDASSAMAELQKTGEYIDGLRPRIAGMSEEAQAQFNALAAKLELVSRQIDNQRNAYQGLQSAALKAEQEQGNGSDAYLKLEKRILSADAASQRLAATQEKLKAELAGVASGAAAAGEQSERAARRSTSGWQKTFDMFGRMLIRIAAFKIYSAIAQGITTGLQDMALANSQANATMSALATDALYLKNSLAAALMPALQALVPILNQVTDALAGVFNTIGMLIARIFNHATTVSIAKRANVDYAATLDKTKVSADAAKKSLMGFDELNVLSKPTEATNPNPGMPSAGSQFETVPIPGWVNQIGSWTDKISGFIKTNIAIIKRILIGAPFVIGAILAFSGANVPLGIALMVVGALLIAKQAKEDWSYLTNKTTSSLDKIKTVLAIVGAVELAIGAILAFSGVNVPLGIALMAGGIMTTAAILNWDSISPNIKKAIGAITFTGALVMLALGAIFAFSGANIPLGVGLLIAGATTMWASKTLNWNSMDAQLKTKVATWTSIASGALLALGILLVCTGAAAPLGIGMIIAGGTGLASAVALNWDAITNKVKSVLDAIVGFFNSMWSNVVKIFEGFPEWWNGIWSKVGQILSDCWNNISAWFNKLPYNIGYALGAALAKIVNFGVDAWNWVTTDLPKIINGIVDWFKQLPGKIWTFLVDVVNKVVQWSKNLVSTAQTEIPKFVTKVTDFIGELPGKMLDIGKNIVQGIWNGITGAVDWLHTKIKGFCDGLLAGFKDNLKIHSPSAVFADVIGKNLALGLGYGFVNYMKPMAALMQDAVPTHFDLATAFSVPDLSSPSISVAAPLAAISNPQDSGILGYNSNGHSESGYAAILESLNKSREEMKDALLNHPTYLVTDNVKLAQAVNRGQRQITRTSPTNA